MKLTDREYLRRHGTLPAERIEALLDECERAYELAGRIHAALDAHDKECRWLLDEFIQEACK